MRSLLAHNQLEAQRFFRRFESSFTTRQDGSTWPKWQRTSQHASEYFRGLVRPGRRKSITGLAKRMNTDQEQLERFVRESPWEYQQVQAHLRNQAPAAVQGSTAALIVDGVAFPKKGKHSVGVGRQWCGVAGKVENCQVAINLTLATPGECSNADQVTWPLAMQLYLPQKWGGNTDSVYDSQRERAQYARLREEAGIPDDITYQPKHVIATDLVEDARDSVDHACVVADAGFGRYNAFRQHLRELEEPYVVEVRPAKTAVVPADAPIESSGPSPGRGPARTPLTVSDEVELETIEEVATRATHTDAWKEIEWAEGSKKTLSGEFYRERVRAVTDQQDREVEDATGWLLIEKEQPAEEESSLKAWLCWDRDDASLEQLVSWAHLRWTIEQYHDNIKQVLGADDFQGRTWDGFHHHLTVVMLTQAFVAEQRLQTGEDGCDLDSFEEVARRLVREAAIQRLMENHDFDRQTAETVAVDMLRGFSEWG